MILRSVTIAGVLGVVVLTGCLSPSRRGAPLPAPEVVHPEAVWVVSAPAALGGGSEEIVPRFVAFRPERLTMPVPVFSRWVDLDALVPGWVEFWIQIDEAGEVLMCELLDASHPALVGPAREALIRARYRPALDPRGRPVGVRFRERIEF